MSERRPFPHVVLDSFLSGGLLQEVVASWPAPDWPGWIEDDPRQPGKRVSDLATPLPDAVGDVLQWVALCDPASRMGMYGTVYDLGCWAAGLSEMAPGSALGLHQDAQAHGRLGLSRVVSCVVYVHEHWQRDWGGELCLCANDGNPAVRLACRPARLVCFASRGAWHSVAAITGPVPRRTITLQGYSGPAPAGARRRAHFGE
jgi:hypothetical protein